MKSADFEPLILSHFECELHQQLVWSLSR